jgi:ADP-heptose:LPS heptosyltransferase
LSKAINSESDGVSDARGEHASRLRAQLEQAQRLLIIRLRSMGDSILAIPLVEALRDWRPALQIDVLVQAPYGCLFARHPAVHEVLQVRSKGGPAGSGWSRSRACAEILKRRYSAVVNLHGGSTSTLFTLASGARIRIGQRKYRQSWAFTALIPSPRTVWQRADLHTVEDQLTLLRWLHLPVPARPRGRLYLDEGARKRTQERLAAAGLGHAGYLLIHPTATLRTKQWPEANFAELADRLHRHTSLPVVFSSGPRETQVLLDIGRHAGSSHHYWSDLSLDELLAVIEGCRLFVGNDSGPTHAAAALGKPLAVVWGSSDFQVWHPWETRYEAVRSSLPCMPCPGHTCAVYGTPRCIEDIPVDQVSDACMRLLGRDAHRQSQECGPDGTEPRP